jgi:hypothetical protein
MGLAGYAEQCVSVTEQNRRVVLFGGGVDIHCEAFRYEDGTNLFRFSSGYPEWFGSDDP